MFQYFKKYINENDEEITYDFANDIDGYESPYSKAQHISTYDSAKIQNPLKLMNELLNYLKANEGRFTYKAFS